MTPKQRFEAAINFKQPEDYVAFMELEFQLHEEYVGKKLITGYDYAKLSSVEKEKALYSNAETMIKVAEKAGHDAIRNIGGYWEVSPGQPALIWLPEMEDQFAQFETIKKLAGDYYYVICSGGGTMGIPDGNHIYDFVVDLFEHPDEVKIGLEKMLVESLESQKRFVQAGADAIINCSDVAFNNGPFISPKMMDEFFFPYFNRWVESVKREGAYSIWHTDGNIMPIMDRTLESGVDALQCIDPLGGMDIVKLKQEVYGKLTLIGNIDCAMLQFGPAEKIEEEVKRVVEGCKGNGGFCLSGCNAIFKGISADNYQVMVDARYKYGKEN